MSLKQCKWCRQVVRLLPYPAEPGKNQNWGAFVDVDYISLGPAAKQVGTVVYAVAPNGKSIAGPFPPSHTMLIATPHQCPNRQ